MVNGLRRLSFLLLTIITLLLGSCSEPNRLPLNIDIQSHFEQDDIEIFIDGKRILRENVQTSTNVGVCFIDGTITQSFSFPEGNHTIKVVLNNALSKSERFALNDELYIGIQFDVDTEELEILYSQEHFVYD